MKIPKLLLEGQKSLILHDLDIVSLHPAVKTAVLEDSVKLTINKKANHQSPIDIILMGKHKLMDYSIEFGRGSEWRVNFFIIPSGQVETINLSISLKDSSTVRINQLFVGTLKQPTTLSRTVTMSQDAKLSLTSAVLTNGTFIMQDTVDLIGSHADYDSEMLVIGQNADDVQINQNVTHKAKKTTSLIHNSIVANDQSKIKFDIYGTIEKYQSASRCFQHSRGIILGETSIIEVDPKLIINEYDVEAGHGAAIGQINQDELYYLSSRGLDENQSKRLIIQGYTDPFVSTFEAINHQKFINHAITLKMGGL